MSNKTTKKGYARLTKLMLEAIHTTPKDNVAAFNKFKKKAKKYVQKIEGTYIRPVK